jgi:hypothetical protein
MNYPDDIHSHDHDPRSPFYHPTWREEVDGAFLAKDLDDLRRLWEDTLRDDTWTRHDYVSRFINLLEEEQIQ